MNYQLLFFDADDTLLDFKKSENVSFQIVLEKNGIQGDIHSLHLSYKKINDLLWAQNAEGLISKDFLKVERFRQFLEINHLDGNPEKLCDDYLTALPQNVFLVDDAFQLLNTLTGKYPLVIVTNGIGVTQKERLKNSGLDTLIDLMVISEECGFNKPDKRIFDHTFKLMKTSPQESRTLMIGDKLETDIMGATNSKIDSCWFNPDKIVNTTAIKPTYQISNLLELLKIL